MPLMLNIVISPPAHRRALQNIRFPMEFAPGRLQGSPIRAFFQLQAGTTLDYSLERLQMARRMPRIWRSPVLWLTAILLFPPLLFGWQDSPEAANQKNIYKVAGTVINAVTGRPVPRVLMTLTGAPERAMLTDAEGKFAFDNLPAGNVELRVLKPGFFRYGKKGEDNPPIQLRVGSDTETITIRLEPEATITGSIAGKNEEPLEHASVGVLQWRSVEGRRQLAAAHNPVDSDEDGNFRIAGLAPGRYYLSVRVQSSRSLFGAAARKADETYPALSYYPASEGVAGATPLDVVAGQRVNVIFTLKQVPSFKVAGVITNGSEWKQLNSPMLSDEFGQVLYQAERFESQSGAFEFPAVPAGTYWLQLGATDQNGRYSSSHRKITIQGNLVDLRLAVPREIDIPVVVRTEFTHPEGAPRECTHFSPSGEMQKSDCSDFPAVNVQLISLDLHNQGFYSDNGPLTARLQVRGVTPGRYAVHVTPVFRGYVQSARCGELDLFREPLLVPENGSPPPIEVVLRDDAATLKIHLNAEKSTQQSLLVLFRDAINMEPQMKTIIYGNEFQTGSLPPGAYRIFAFDTTDDVDYADPDTLAKYSSKAASITLSANGQATALVDLIHIGE